MADTKKTKIIIDSSDHNGGKPVLINGQFRFRIPYNTEVEVDDDELEALRNSNTEFRIVGDPSSATAGAEGALAPADDPAARAAAQAGGGMGGEDRPPVRELVDNERAGLDAAEARQSAESERAAAEASEAEESEADPEQSDADPEADEGDEAEGEQVGAESDEGELNGGRFSAKTVLDQSIAKITEDMDEFTPRQVQSLLDTENKAENPRSTLIAALEKKLAPPAA